MKTKISIIALVLLSLLFVSVAEAKPKAEKANIDPDFEQFWKEFQAAVKSGDKDKVISMMSFPLNEPGGIDEPTTFDDFINVVSYKSTFNKRMKGWINSLKTKDFKNCEESYEDTKTGETKTKTIKDCFDAFKAQTDNGEDGGNMMWLTIKKFNGIYRLCGIRLYFN